MGLMDSLMGVLNQVGGAQGAGKGAIDGIMDIFRGSGMKGILQEFQNSGLGDIINSWISSGKNLPISTEQIKDALGMDRIREFAQKAGVDEEASIDMLKKMLPDVVDKMTPKGSVEE